MWHLIHLDSLWFNLLRSQCWKRSSRGHNGQMTCVWAGPGQPEAPHPSPILGMQVPPTIRTVSAIVKDTVLRDNCLLEWICDWNQLRPHYKILRSWPVGVRIDLSCVPETNLTYVLLFIKAATYQPTNSSFLLSLPFVCGEQFQISPRKLPRVRTNTQIRTTVTLCPCILPALHFLGPLQGIASTHRDALLQAMCLAAVAQRPIIQGLCPLEVTVRLYKIWYNSL